MSVTIVESGAPIRTALGVPAVLLAGPQSAFRASPASQGWKSQLTEQLNNLPYEALVYHAGKDRRWLIDAADSCDVILFRSHETLLEEEDSVLVAMYAGSGKLMMNCHRSFWNHGSPAAIAAKAKCVASFESFESLVSAAIERITEVASGEDVFNTIRDEKFCDGMPKKLFESLKPFVNAQNAPAVAQTIHEVFTGES